MLKVKTYLGLSKTHGIGVFTASPIKKGSLVWVYEPAIDLSFDPKSWENLKLKLSPESFAEIQKYAYKNDGIHYLCVDNAQFMNHSDTAFNLQQEGLSSSDYAVRDIAANEELLCNYFSFCDPDDANVLGLR